VGVEHVRDPHSLVPRERDVVVDLRLAGVDHRAESLSSAAEQVRRAAVLEVEEWSEYHRGCAEVCTGRPDALHSGNPSVSRRARRPRARSLATACQELQRNAGRQFSPRVVAAFLGILRRDEVLQTIEEAMSRWRGDTARLTDEELDRFTGQLQVVLGAIEQLKDVDTSAVPPSASVLPLENVMREDEPRPSLPVEVVLAQAPDREGDLFRVQASLEERPDA